jgi:hypothetical protein
MYESFFQIENCLALELELLFSHLILRLLLLKKNSLEAFTQWDEFLSQGDFIF